MNSGLTKKLAALGLVSVAACGPEVDEARFRRIVREELGKEAGRLRAAKRKSAQLRRGGAAAGRGGGMVSPGGSSTASWSVGPAGPSSAAGYPGIRRVGPHRYEVSRSVRARFHLDAARSARIIPIAHNGKPDGFRLYAIRKNSLFDAMGLRNGDVVRTVNGVEITSPDKALKVYDVIKIASTVTVGILRRGRPITLTYVIK